MARITIVKDYFNREEVRDYTYIIIFLLISTFFGFVVIRPALSIAISLNREATDLRNLREVYEKNNSKLISIEQSLENIRGRVYLVDQALPQRPSTKIMIDDIKKAALKGDISIKNLNLSSVNLKSDSKDQRLKSISLTMEIVGDYTQLQEFFSKLINQRRIKNIKSLKIFKEDEVATTGANLKAVLEVEGYYL